MWVVDPVGRLLPRCRGQLDLRFDARVVTGVCVTRRIVSGILGRDFRFVGVVPDGGCPARLEDPRFIHTEDLVISSISAHVIAAIGKRTELVVCYCNVVQWHTTRVLDGVFPCDRSANTKMGACARVRILAIRCLFDVNPELPNRYVLVTGGGTATGIAYRHGEHCCTRTTGGPSDRRCGRTRGDCPITGDRPVVGSSWACVCYHSGIARAAFRDTTRCCNCTSRSADNRQGHRVACWTRTRTRRLHGQRQRHIPISYYRGVIRGERSGTAKRARP